MADHIRQQLVDALEAALQNLASTGANVFQQRNVPADDGKLPCLLIYNRTEKSEFGNMGTHTARALDRMPQIMIVGCCRVAGADPDRTLNRIAAEIEARVAVNADLNGLTERIELLQTDFDVPALGDGQPHDKRAGRVGLLYRCETCTAAGDPTVRI